MRLAAGDDELAAIDRLELSGAHLDALARAIDLGAVTIEGARARASRDKSGAVTALGLRFRPAPREGEPASAPPPDASAPARVPHVHWGEVVLRGSALSWTDEAVEPAASLALRELELTLGARHLDHEAHAETPDVHSPAPFKLHFAIDSAVDSLDADGELFPSLRAPVLNAHVRASGVTLEAFAPYLESAGLAPSLAKGDLALQLEASAAIGRGETHASVAIRDVLLEDGREELLGLDRATLALRYDPAARSVDVSLAEIQRPRLLVTRTKTGEVALLGVALRARARPPEADVAAVASSSPPLGVLLRSASVHGLSVHWRDALANVALDLERASLELGAARLGAGGEPGPVRVHAEVEGVGSLDLTGTATLDASAPFLEAQLTLGHLEGAPLAPYLAPRAELLLEDGSLRARLHVEAGSSPQGGRRIAARITEAELFERTRPLLSFATLEVSVPRADVAGKVFAVEQLSLDGLEGAVERLADGRLALLGFAFRPASGPAPPPAPRDPGRQVPDATDASPLPQVTVTQAVVSVRKVTFVDRASALGADAPPPFVLTEAGLSLVQPFILSLDDPEAATLEVEVHGKMDPVARNAVFYAHGTPFDAEPQLSVSFEVEGISGPAILERLPRAAERWDLSSVTDGLAKGALALTLKRTRRRLDQVLGDLRAAPLALDLTASGEARSTPDGPVLLGADEVHLDVAQLDLATGETRVRALEVVNPKLRLRREDAGLRFLDAVLKTAPDKPLASAAGPGPAPSAPASDAAEQRVDRVSITDGDIVLEDLTVQPAASVQLGGLEVEVLGLSSRALREHRPVRLRVGAKGGTVFDEVSGRGTLTFSPRIEGDVDLSLVGLKLPPVSGYTSRAWQLGIRDGRLDAEARLRFRFGRLDSATRVQLSSVQVHEPSQGSVISRKIGVMSLGTAFAILRDDDDVVAFPVPLRLELDEQLRLVGEQVDVGGLVAEGLLVALKGTGAKLLGGFEGIRERDQGRDHGQGRGRARDAHRRVRDPGRAALARDRERAGDPRGDPRRRLDPPRDPARRDRARGRGPLEAPRVAHARGAPRPDRSPRGPPRPSRPTPRGRRRPRARRAPLRDSRRPRARAQQLLRGRARPARRRPGARRPLRPGARGRRSRRRATDAPGRGDSLRLARRGRARLPRGPPRPARADPSAPAQAQGRRRERTLGASRRGRRRAREVSDEVVTRSPSGGAPTNRASS